MVIHHSEMVRLGWTDYAGLTSNLVTVSFLGRSPVKVQKELVEATAALEQALIENGYENPCDYVGSYYYRTIGGSGTLSEHAYGTALDIDYGGDNPDSPDHGRPVDNNPHLKRRIDPGDPGFGTQFQFTESDVRVMERIKNVHGEQIWGWLGWRIGDTMHVAVKVRPDRTQVDWSTVGGEEMWANDFTDKTWMAMFHSGVPGVKGEGRYYCSNDGTYTWPADKPWGSNPIDGGAAYEEKVNAVNYLLAGFSQAAGSKEN